jgi:hypothetical protein
MKSVIMKSETNGTAVALVDEDRRRRMYVAGGLAVLVLICLLLSMVQTPPAVGR